MQPDKPPILGNQVGMDGFDFGGRMRGTVGNQTEVVIGPGQRGAVTQLTDPGDKSSPDNPGGSGPQPRGKDEGVSTLNGEKGDSSAIAPPSDPTKVSGGFLDGHVFLVLLGAGAVALALWGWEK